MTNNDILHGFRRVGEQPSKETGSTIVYYEHETSGAHLVHLQNEDPHMAFGIGFRTLPEDSTGVAHILEHSVLSGSRKFKTREPFMELLKGSMNTFLNAMTFPDMTIYPISSQNRKDLRNLIDVYMDAVLFPRIHEMKEIFLQEGWHHHILSPDEPITYNGVVYNEMKGAYSSPEANVAIQVARALNQGTTYDHESGGYPYDIPRLSYEGLKEFHTKYYHPSNSMIYLYGDIDREDLLRLLDEEYLCHFQRKNPDSDLVLKEQEPGIKRFDFEYPADENQTAKEHSYLSYAVSLGHADSVDDYFINTILNEVLIQSESSPIKQALLEKGLGEDFMSLSGDTYYLDFGLAAKHTADGRLDEFVGVIESTLKHMTEQGIDEKLLLAALNRTEFKLREARGTLKGIIYFINVMSAWRYGNDAASYLNFDDVFARMRLGMKEGLFERIIQERILNNPVKILAIHRPKANLFGELDRKVEEELAELKAGLSQEALADLIAENEKLLKFQTTEDSKEDKATIPHLDLSDIDRHIPHIEEESVRLGNADLLFHPWNSSDISYLTAAFSMAPLEREDIVWAGYLAAVLGIIGTDKYTYSELNNEINIYTSGLHFSPSVFKKLSGPDEYEARFNVYSSAMGDYYPKMFEFLDEVLFRTGFSDNKRLKEIFLMLRSNLESSFDFQGHTIVMQRVASFFNQASRYLEELSGIDFYDHLNLLLKDFDGNSDLIQTNLRRVAKRLFGSQDLVLSLTGEPERKSELMDAAADFIRRLPQGSARPAVPLVFELGHRKEGLTSASGVQYAAKGYNLKKLGFEYTGEMVVLASILSMDYLHNAIRARGGAYGAGISIDPFGNAVTYSYRDPNLRNTVNVYDGMSDFLRNFALDEDDVKNYIIGTMPRFNPPLTASDINTLVLARRFSGSSEAEIEKRMSQAIDTRKDSIMAKAQLMDQLMKQDYLCVLGSQDKINQEKDLFSVIRPIKINQ